MEHGDARLSLEVNSKCSIFSRSTNRWLDGKVRKILVDERNKEWLVVKYANNKSKKIQRFCEDLRCTEPLKKRIFGWEKMAEPPFDIEIGNQHSNPVSLNAMEFAIATEMLSEPLYGSFSGGIYVFSVIINNWMLLREYPRKLPFLKSTKLSLAFNADTNELYIYGVHENALYSVLAKLNIYTRKFKHSICKTYNAGIGSTALMIDGQLHLIGGAVSNKHAIYNEQTKNFDITYEIWNNPTNTLSVTGNTQNGVIHSIKQSMMWVLGGGTKKENMTGAVWGHDTSGTYYHLVPDSAWNELQFKMPHPIYSFGCCLCYGKYIIVIGGNTPNVYVMDSTKMGYDTFNYSNNKLYGKGKVPSVFEGKSTLSLPLYDLQTRSVYHYHAVMLPVCPEYDSSLMICGFIKDYVCKGYDRYITDRIIDTIFEYMQTEYIYIIQNEAIKPKLWRIAVDDILNSIVPL